MNGAEHRHHREHQKADPCSTTTLRSSVRTLAGDPERITGGVSKTRLTTATATISSASAILTSSTRP